VFVVSAAFVLPGTVLFAKLSKFRCQIAGGFLLAHLEHERLAFCLFKKEKFEMAQAHNACREAGQISCAHRKATRGDKHNVRRYLFLYRLFIFFSCILGYPLALIELSIDNVLSFQMQFFKLCKSYGTVLPVATVFFELQLRYQRLNTQLTPVFQKRS